MPLKEFIFDRYTTSHDWVWAGVLSKCHSTGSIVNIAKQIIAGLEKPITFVVSMSDGYADVPNHLIAIKDRAHFESIVKDENTIVGILCTRNFSHPRAVLLPLDDESFNKGVIDEFLCHTPLPRWEDRKPIAFWRGCLSGGLAPTLRTRVVWELHDFPFADVKFNRLTNMTPEYQGRFVFSEDGRFYDEPRGANVHVQHKYIPILDGNCIASAQQWVFASGSVPIMVTHPDNDFWFKKYLKPGFHYVSIKYDLSDLREKIEWLVNNDAEAKQIANNAMEFARTVLSSEFQHGYLMKEIRRVAGV
jgi:hypothetical protein